MGQAIKILPITERFVTEHRRLKSEGKMIPNGELAHILGIKSASNLSNILAKKQNIQPGAWEKFKEMFVVSDISEGGHNDRTAQMDTVLPLGNIRVTVADYIRRIEQFNDTLSNAINQGLVKIDANLKDVLQKVDSADRSAKADRQIMMDTLGEISGKGEALSKEADTLERGLHTVKQQKGKTQDAGK